MNLRQVLIFSVMALFATSAFSGEKNHHKMKVEVIADDGTEPTYLVLDSDDLGFNLQDMQVGENQSIVDKEGRPVLITRNEEGYVFDIDGKQIEVPGFDGAHDGNHRVKKLAIAPDADIDVHVIREDVERHRALESHALLEKEGVMIMSGKEIDAATQQVIRDALQAAGHESVHFAEGFGGEMHQVKVIKKVVEVSD